jgi:hypothetical protein
MSKLFAKAKFEILSVRETVVSCVSRPDGQPVPLIPVRLSERESGVGFTDPPLQKVKKMFTESEDQTDDQKSATAEPLPHINAVATGLFDYNLKSDRCGCGVGQAGRLRSGATSAVGFVAPT